MRTAVRTQRVTKSQLGVAVVLLIGVLVTAYGYSHPSNVAFYCGLFLTAGGIITGVIQAVTRV